MLTNPATRYIMANVLQTKVDAKCDKLATKLSGQCLRRSTFSSYSELFIESCQFCLHLMPPLGVTAFELPRSSASESCVTLFVIYV